MKKKTEDRIQETGDRGREAQRRENREQTTDNRPYENTKARKHVSALV